MFMIVLSLVHVISQHRKSCSLRVHENLLADGGRDRAALATRTEGTSVPLLGVPTLRISLPPLAVDVAPRGCVLRTPRGIQARLMPFGASQHEVEISARCGKATTVGP